METDRKGTMDGWMRIFVQLCFVMRVMRKRATDRETSQPINIHSFILDEF